MARVVIKLGSSIVADERGEVALEVGIAEEQRAGAGLALGEGQRLPLAEPRQPHDPRSRPFSRVRGPVARAVVGDEDLCLGERGAESDHRRPDRPLLVARCDEHGQAVSHAAG